MNRNAEYVPQPETATGPAELYFQEFLTSSNLALKLWFFNRAVTELLLIGSFTSYANMEITQQLVGIQQTQTMF